MNENEWVTLVVRLINDQLPFHSPEVEAVQGLKLPYSNEIRSYNASSPVSSERPDFETDITIREMFEDDEWIPRVVIEAKLSRVSTHDAITYSEKAESHKKVHPYLRYGIFIGNRQHYPLPGRLYRHGAYFDFMISWKDFDPDENELRVFIELLVEEIQASRDLEEVLYSSRKTDREKYTVLHRQLVLKG